MGDQYWNMSNSYTDWESSQDNLKTIEQFFRGSPLYFCVLEPGQYMTFPNNWSHITISLENTFQIGLDQFPVPLFDQILQNILTQQQFSIQYKLHELENENRSVAGCYERCKDLLWTWRTIFEFSPEQLDIVHQIEENNDVRLKELTIDIVA